jgi:UDP-N-acetylmuramoyl-tripeptide--D-alanyl-D-alanine ligase
MDIRDLYQKYLESGKVSTDTRQITPGSVFFALKGPSFNANAFAQEALSRGASYCVVDEAAFAKDPRFVLVPDSLVALQDLARHHRSQLNIPVIGLTGSNGKTTSKELVSTVLSRKFKTYSTRGNLNNHIGVPLTVLSIDHSYEIAVVEMGANHVGEIAMLSDIARPTHGFITNIGKAHIGTFGGFENIIRGKTELYQHLIDHQGTVFINSTNPILSAMIKRFKEPVLYPASGDFLHCTITRTEPWLEVMTEQGAVIRTQLVGAYNFENIAVALCIGKFFGVNPVEAAKAIEAYAPGNMRSQVIQKGTNTIILDAYNANPTSMEAAIDSLSRMKAERKIAILGDMFELEEEAVTEHRHIGAVLRDRKIDEAYLCGELMQNAKTTFPQGKFFRTRDELVEALKAAPVSGATILIKGSRGMAMEKVADLL